MFFCAHLISAIENQAISLSFLRLEIKKKFPNFSENPDTLWWEIFRQLRILSLRIKELIL